MRFQLNTLNWFTHHLNSVQKITDAIVSHYNSEHPEKFDSMFAKAPNHLQQTIMSNMGAKDSVKSAQLKAKAANTRILNSYSQKSSGRLNNNTNIDHQQREMKTKMEEELALFPTAAGKKQFLSSLINSDSLKLDSYLDSQSFVSNTELQAGDQLARLRGIQQAIQSDKGLNQEEKNQLNNQLAKNVRTQFIQLNDSSMVPKGDRSFDHIIHFLDGSTESEKDVVQFKLKFKS